MKLFNKPNLKRENTFELEIWQLKSEIYDKEKEIKQLKSQLKREKEIINKIRALPTSKKRELGIL